MSQVSRLCEEIDGEVKVFLARPMEAVDLVGFGVGRVVLLEDLDMAATAAIEIEAEYLAVSEEIELSVEAQHVLVEPPGSVQVACEDHTCATCFTLIMAFAPERDV